MMPRSHGLSRETRGREREASRSDRESKPFIRASCSSALLICSYACASCSSAREIKVSRVCSTSVVGCMDAPIQMMSNSAARLADFVVTKARPYDGITGSFDRRAFGNLHIGQSWLLIFCTKFIALRSDGCLVKTPRVGVETIAETMRSAPVKKSHASRIAATPAEKRPDRSLRHDAEKCAAVFRKDHAQSGS